MTAAWAPDVLGDGFEAATVTLPPDAEGEVVATVVRHRAPGPSAGAVLYVHGFNDYFFQDALARWYAGRGWDFYAVDLRKYGRSLRPWQTANLCRSLEDYDDDLDAAAAVVAADGHSRVLLAGHSTGGLTVSLWLARRPALPSVGVVLNSPFLAFKQPAALRAALMPVAAAVARHRPARVLPAGVSGLYGESLHASRRGEWDFNLDWKPLRAPVRVGFVAAVGAGQRTLDAGLGLEAPVLVLASTRTVTVSAWDDDLTRGDAVLDADRIAGRAPAIGRNVTVLRVPDALHDVYLSAAAVRDRAYRLTGQWLDAWVTPARRG
ncbi:alpha/beta hydrolase [Acidiferrimicrobium sp. IK]|uniref:alpha/beta hydrolase n=1 Tax=Acidiferrimicrobium sp. IK TaxID=2871700 RepID=UPI0021CB544C|nr:alpha/beta hydrolase [Acidiferrimicrobium sp. IK]MCU4186957.1 alpha/beta hydrolase [Acidiferrimicrobium sp. IK]